MKEVVHTAHGPEGEQRRAEAEASPMAPVSEQRPMWCDDFDVDLPKVVPGARQALGDVADVRLWTTGHETLGALNSPTMWNTDLGLTALFFRTPRRPEAFYYTKAPLLECTFWEAIRDMWVHAGAMLVDGRLIADTERWHRHFETLLWQTRGWGNGFTPGKVERARGAVRRGIYAAAVEMRRLLSDGASRQDETPDAATGAEGDRRDSP